MDCPEGPVGALWSFVEVYVLSVDCSCIFWLKFGSCHSDEYCCSIISKETGFYCWLVVESPDMGTTSKVVQ